MQHSSLRFNQEMIIYATQQCKTAKVEYLIVPLLSFLSSPALASPLALQPADPASALMQALPAPLFLGVRQLPARPLLPRGALFPAVSRALLSAFSHGAVGALPASDLWCGRSSPAH